MASTDYIERVAIVGATGRIGGYFTRSLVKTGKHTVTALVRKGSKGTIPTGAKSVEVDFDDHASLVSVLSGQQFLVITLSAMVPAETHTKIVQAAAEAGVAYIMPNSFSNDFLDASMVKEDLYSAGSVAKCNEIVEAGSSFIAMACGFWYQLSLRSGGATFGIDIKEKKATFFDKGDAFLPVSTWDLCGHALAKLLSLPVRGADVSIDRWKNKPLFFASFHVTQRDILDSVHRVLGDTDADWAIEHESSRERYDKAMADLQTGDSSGYVRALYTRPFFPNGGGDFKTTRGLSNELLGLPEESLDEATKDVVEAIQSGRNTYG